MKVLVILLCIRLLKQLSLC